MTTLSREPGQMGYPVSDPFALIMADHSEFKGFLEQWPRVFESGNQDELKGLIRTMVSKISAHTSMEEQALHELYESRLGPEGKRFFDESLEYDNRDKAALDLFEKSSTFENRELLLSTFNKLRLNLLEHIRLEEEVYFPQLRAKLNQQELDSLYSKLVSLRESGRLPSHPHPLGPSGPLGAKLMHPVAAMVDRVTDSLTGQK